MDYTKDQIARTYILPAEAAHLHLVEDPSIGYWLVRDPPGIRLGYFPELTEVVDDVVRQLALTSVDEVIAGLEASIGQHEVELEDMKRDLREFVQVRAAVEEVDMEEFQA